MSVNPVHVNLTPAQLADRLDALVDEVIALGKSEPIEHEWAEAAYAKHLFRLKNNPTLYTPKGVVLPTERARELCPELFEQVIDSGVAIASRKYGLPSPYLNEGYREIHLDRGLDNAANNTAKNRLLLGIKRIRTQNSMEGLCALVSHERAHFLQDFSNRVITTDGQPAKWLRYASGVTASHIAEHDADRGADPIGHIERILSSITHHPEYYNNKHDGSTHPNDRSRLKASLQEALGNSVFGMNGRWVEKEGNHYFVANDFNASPKEIIRKQSQLLGHSGKIDERSFRETRHNPMDERGYMVKNWQALHMAIEAKAEALLSGIDTILSESLFKCELEAVYPWFNRVKEEIHKFEEEHKPEFALPKEALWRDRAQRVRSSSQQGGGFRL